MKTIKVQLNTDLCGIKKGTIMDLGTVKYPLTAFWLRRIRDSKFDNCLSVIKKPSKDKPITKIKKVERVKNGD